MIFDNLLMGFMLVNLARGIPIADSEPEFNNLTNPYTLTAYKPDDCLYHGLKVNNLGLFQAATSGYCPFTGAQSSICPNGTDTVFANSLYPLSEVPGGQDLFVNVDGSIEITVQHSHSIPPGAYWEYIGWTWTPLPVHQLPIFDCPSDDPEYNCEPPIGYWNFKAPNSTAGGVVACDGGNGKKSALYAVTPEFNKTGCVELKGLGTHPYAGVNPPVWAYY